MKNYSFFLILLSFLLLACNLGGLTATPPGPEVILAEVLQALDRCLSDAGVEAGENTASFSCRHSADSYYTVSLTRFESAAAARAQFESGLGTEPIVCFHGYDQYRLISFNPGSDYIQHEQLGWLAGEWLVSVYASYDYAYFHFTTLDFAEAVYASASEHGLLSAGTCP